MNLDRHTRAGPRKALLTSRLTGVPKFVAYNLRPDDICDQAATVSRIRLFNTLHLSEMSVTDSSGREHDMQEFIAGFLSGDHKRIELVRTRLSRYIRHRYTADEEEREDLVAEIMSILLLSLRSGQFRGTDIKSFNAYLYGIARLKIMQVVERNGRRGDLAQHLVSGDLPVGRITDPDTRAMNSTFLKHIYDGLGEQCGEMIRMKFIQGWSDQEIADYRQISKNALSTALSRCLKKARELPVVQELLYQKRS